MATAGSTGPDITAALVWEGMGINRSEVPYVSCARKNGQALLDMKERFLLA